MNIRNKVFVTSISILLLSVSVYIVFIKSPEEISITENRNMSQFAPFTIKSFYDNSFQANLEASLADQFILRDEIVKILAQVEFNTSMLFRAGGNSLELIEIGDTGVARIGAAGSHYINYPMTYNEEYVNNFIERTTEINELATDYPEVEFYVYKPTQGHELDIFDEASNLDSYGRVYEQILEDTLTVPYQELTVSSYLDLEQMFYPSDHHWNHIGAYTGYSDMIHMMLGNEESLLEPSRVECYGNLQFYGTFSSRTGNITGSGDFCTYVFTYPRLTAVADGNTENPVGYIESYLEGHYVRDNVYINHYNYAYGLYDKGFIAVNNTENDSDDNLLVIRDSYAVPLVNLIASHFDETYYVSPKMNKQITGQDFYYDSFIKEHEITKVLFMYTVENYFYVERDYFKVNRD